MDSAEPKTSSDTDLESERVLFKTPEIKTLTKSFQEKPDITGVLEKPKIDVDLSVMITSLKIYILLFVFK